MDYEALTVPQLRALCKERKIIGYSKVGKSALIEKITSFSAKDATGRNDDIQSHKSNPSLLQRNNLKAALDSNIPEAVLHAKDASSHAFDDVDRTCEDGTHISDAGVKAALTAHHSSPLKKASRQVSQISGSDYRDVSPETREEEVYRYSEGPKRKDFYWSNVSSKKKALSRQLLSYAPPSKRFKMLQPMVCTSRSVQSHLSVCSQTNESLSTSYLELTFLPSKCCNNLKAITYPPSLAQRKSAVAWSIFLSHIEDRDRQNCALTCRTLRYGVLLSAIFILRKDFTGRRLSKFIQPYNSSVTNFWPYLIARRRERETALNAYKNSFLPEFYKNHNPIAPQLWSSPDHAKQINIAMRFVLTRAWYFLSMHNTEDMRSSCWTVTDAEEIVKDEIWSITTEPILREYCGRRNGREVFYILESTCEVIGTPNPFDHKYISHSDANSEPLSFDNLPLRADWSEYIQHHLLGPGFHTGPPPTLISHLKWTHNEEYDHGISRHWLNRIEKEGVLGQQKKKVAERYVMACLVANSVSGKWMTCTEMAQEISCKSLTSTSDGAKRQPTPRVNLFLPAHHHIESVHFKSQCGKNLHPSLAVIQTPAREYYILRDNGMEAGCEEDGVWSLWRKLLQCDEKGLTVQAV